MTIPVSKSTRRLLTTAAFLATATTHTLAYGQTDNNRDVHGPPDVQSYIQNLLDSERIAELKPVEVVAALMLPENAMVADLGSGPGVFTLPLARQVSRGVVYAVDIEPQQLDALRDRVTAAGLDNVVPVLASSSKPYLPPSHVDLVLVVDTYHHLEDRVDYFRRLRGMLRAGGRLAILEYKPGDLPAGPPLDAKLPAGLRAQELQEAGYSLLGAFDMHEYHDFEIWVPSTRF